MIEHRVRVDIHGAGAILGPEGKPRARSTIYRDMEKNPDFPRPFSDGYRLQWFADELYDYIASRPRRQYAALEDEGIAEEAEDREAEEARAAKKARGETEDEAEEIEAA
jgi:hypothetical protein